MAKYGEIRIDKSDCFIASNSGSESTARSVVLIGSSLAWIKFMATNIPKSEPMGLNACAKLSLRVAFSSGPIVKMYGLALVSRKERPQVRTK